MSFLPSRSITSIFSIGSGRKAERNAVRREAQRLFKWGGVADVLSTQSTREPEVVKGISESMKYVMYIVALTAQRRRGMKESQ